MFRKKIYKWHRYVSLVVAIPVLLWAISGFMHPVMTNIRPQVATQVYIAPAVDTAQIKVSLTDALRKNSIDSLHNVRIVHIGGLQFYQVIVKPDKSSVIYISTQTGQVLEKGDALYARYLAKQFLEGQEKIDSTQMANLPVPEPSSGTSLHDCCVMATSNVLNNTKGAKVKSVEKITAFSSEYKNINRLLPAYKVSFLRNDGIRIYVETTSDRFSFAMDNKRAMFDTLFGWFHTWEWLNVAGQGKYVLMVLVTLLALATTVMGLYIFFTTKTKKSDNAIVKARRRHRITALIASLFTLMFVFSGGFHALEKLLPAKEPAITTLQDVFATSDIKVDFDSLLAHNAGNPVSNISLKKIAGQTYWQLFLPSVKKEQSAKKGDLMKNREVALQPVLYVHADSNTVLDNGEEVYACYLAVLYSGNPDATITSLKPITRFTSEYGFINKRLPVWKVDYNNERYYVETSSGALSTRIDDNDLYEGYSFAFLHKHHYMDWGGKQLRDVSTMLAAGLQVLMVIVGIVLWRRSRRRVIANTNTRRP